MKPGIITQARMGSTRLPGKVMKTVNGRPLLDYHLVRAQETDLPVIVATSDKPDDDVIVDFCEKKNIPIWRGSEEDVLSRYVDAAERYEIDPVIRITSDCPLIDPELLLEGFHQFKETGVDYLRTVPDSPLPHGLDFQIISLLALRESNHQTTDPYDREHVVPFIEKHDRFRKKQFKTKSSEDHSDIRITVDYPEDFQLIQLLIEKHNAHEMTRSDLLGLFDHDSHLKEVHKNARSRAQQ